MAAPASTPPESAATSEAPAELQRLPARSTWPFLEASAAAPADAAFDPAAVTQRNYFLVLDASGSMKDQKCSGNDRKIDVAKRALTQFASRIPPDANVGGLVFDDRGIHSLIPIGPLDPVKLKRAVDSVRAGGGTPLAQSIREAYSALTQRAVSQLGYGEYHLVVVTDGEASGEDPRGIVNRLIAESPVVLHTIGFCIGDQHSLNQPGRTIYRAADNPRQLEQGLQDVLAESPTFNVARFK